MEASQDHYVHEQWSGMDNKGRWLRWAPSGAMKSGKRSEQIWHKCGLSKRGLGLDTFCKANKSHSFVDQSDRGKLFPCCLTTRPSLIPLHQFTCHRCQFAASLSPLVHSRQQCQPALCVLSLPLCPLPNSLHPTRRPSVVPLAPPSTSTLCSSITTRTS